MSVSGGASAQLREEKSFSLIERLKRPALGLVVLVLALTFVFWMLDITATFAFISPIRTNNNP